jgi:serine/threonine protein kinase
MNADPNHTKSIFLEAVEKHEPAQWPAFLDQACAGQPDLRQRVEVLLTAHREAGTAGHRAGAEDASPALLSVTGSNEQPGSVIGPYKLLQQIGEGGMGTVFMAEQTQPVQRKVALKLIKPGMDTRQVIARFEAERQALALMEHPNIAKVFDAGTTDAGRPYFVMELVRGVPLTKYCDEHRLTPRQRLELFVPVCQAVQHAHQKGIIHRDLKPSNVLIAPYDGKPVVKVIDFGVAKATGQRLTERTLFTEFGAVLGTLEYMSPEQAELNNQDIDTRSDIYSLGALLYELLTGTTPLDRARLKKTAFADMLRIIRDEEPPKPSTRLSESKGSLPSISAQRQTEPAKLTKLVRGELDWIVMKALDKDRNRRYETANGFAMDVQRYLTDEPVQAFPPSASYRLRKFVRRNKRPFAAAVALATLLVLGIVGTSIGLAWALQAEHEATLATEAEAEQRQDAETQRDRALTAEALAKTRTGETEEARKEAVANLRTSVQAVDQMLTRVADKLANVPQMEPVRKALLEDALKFYQAFLQRNSVDPALRLEAARAWHRVGSIYGYFEQHVEAEKALRESVTLLEKLVADFPSDPDYRVILAENSLTLGDELLFHFGRSEEAAPILRRVLVLCEKLAAEHPEIPAHRRRLARLRISLGSVQARSSGTRAAEEEYRSALALADKLAEEFPKDGYCYLQAEILHKLGDLLAQTDAQEAEKAYRKVLAIRVVALAEDPHRQWNRFSVIWTQTSLAHLLRTKGRLSEAEEPYRQAIALGERLVADFPNTLNYRSQLCGCLAELGELLEATTRSAEAEEAYRRAWAVATDQVRPEAQPPGHWFERLNRSQILLVKLLSAADRTQEVEAQYRRELALWEKLAAQSPGVPDYRNCLARTYCLLGEFLVADKRPQDAEKVFLQNITRLEETLNLQKAKVGPDDPEMRNYLTRSQACLVKLLTTAGRTNEVEAHYRHALTLWENLATRSPAIPNYRDELVRAYRLLGEFLVANKRPEEVENLSFQAIAVFEKVWNLQKAKLAPDDPGASHQLGVALNNLAWRLATCPDVKLRKPKRAVELANKAVALAPKNGSFWNTVGVAHYRAGDWQACLDALKKSAEFPPAATSWDWFFQAMAHWQLDDKERACQYYQQAVDWMAKNAPENEELRRFRAEASDLLGLHENANPKKD